MRLVFSACLAACTVVAVVAPASPAQNDVIRVKGGKDVVGRIEHENLTGLEVSIHRGTSRKLEWDEVVSIEYGGDKQLDAARDDQENGRLDDARKSLTALAGDEKLRRPLRQEARIRLARLEDRFGKSDDAIAQYRAFLADFPAGRWFADASAGLVDLLIASQSPDVARTELEAALTRAKSAVPGAGADVDSVGSALRGRVLEAQKDYVKARAEYERGARDPKLDADLAARGRLGVARCLRGEGRVADATARLREIVKTESQPEILAGAWNDLADLTLDAGFAKRDGDAIRIAVYSYLRGVVQYAPADRGRSPEHQRALAGAARAFDYEAQLATDPQAKRLAQRRAAELRSATASSAGRR